jgi:hypothetical protein
MQERDQIEICCWLLPLRFCSPEGRAVNARIAPPSFGNDCCGLLAAGDGGRHGPAKLRGSFVPRPPGCCWPAAAAAVPPHASGRCRLAASTCRFAALDGRWLLAPRMFRCLGISGAAALIIPARLMVGSRDSLAARPCHCHRETSQRLLLCFGFCFTFTYASLLRLHPP